MQHENELILSGWVISQNEFGSEHQNEISPPLPNSLLEIGYTTQNRCEQALGNIHLYPDQLCKCLHTDTVDNGIQQPSKVGWYKPNTLGFPK